MQMLFYLSDLFAWCFEAALVIGNLEKRVRFLVLLLRGYRFELCFRQCRAAAVLLNANFCRRRQLRHEQRNARVKCGGRLYPREITEILHFDPQSP